MIKNLLLFLLFFTSVLKTTVANNILEFDGETTLIGKSVYVFEDKSKTLNIKNVLDKKFTLSTEQTPNLKLNDSDFWLKINIKNNSNKENLMLMIEFPTFDKCEFYLPIKNGFEVQSINANNRFAARKYPHQNLIFDINIPKGDTKTYYFKMNSSEQMILPITLGTQQKIAEKIASHDLFWGIWIGIVFVMIFYNLFLYISIKDKSYLYYVFYTTFIGLTQITLSGYTFRFIFSNHPELFNKSLIIFPGIAGLFAVWFVRSFLNTKLRTPKLNKLFNIVLVMYSSAIILRLLNFDIASYRMIDFSALSITILIYTIAIKISLQGYRPAKYFLLAWSVFLLGLGLVVLRNLEIIADNSFTNYIMQIGIAFEVTLLSLALADRINILKKEKEESQLKALNASLENEKLIKEQNVILEQKVNERTAELQETNEELTVILEDLKQTQSQLVASEKMASLGQLTAGIAHEINNPINFVSSNVKPLQRDVQMLFDTIDALEDIGLSEKDKAQKIQEIAKHKEDLDFDYLKIEINHLLRGISDGAHRTAEIVKGLRIFSRVDENDLKMADINEGIDSTLVIMNSALNSQEIIVTKEFDSIPLIECFPGKLNQVFLNIISNAIHALKDKPKKEGVLNIKTSFNGENIFIKFKDNGVGMDEQTVNKMFEPFFTTKDVGEGTGLGMSITYNTIKKHNGSISVDSKVGVGTEITIRLPLKYKL